jgi:hypothetical protein
MRIRRSFAAALGLTLLTPMLLAQSAVNGSLGQFSSGSQGGQSAGSWGIPSAGQSGGQSTTQSSANNSSQSSQSTTQESGKAPGEGDGSNTTQDPKGEPNEGENTTQDPKGEPNEGENTTQDPKGEPNEGDGDGGRNGSSSSGSSSGSGSGSGSGDPYPPLGPTDGQYDPANENNDGEVPTGCADAESECAQCVRRHEAAIQFNRTYLHVAWSISHDTLEMAKKALAFGDTVSGIHQVQGLAWQLGGRPQIEEAVRTHKRVYHDKYEIYIGHIEDSLRAMARCEQENFAISDLYERFGVLYLEMLKSRYESSE